MDNSEATRTCGQCHKEIAEVNFALHETHCSRFLCLCPDCDEPVPREKLDQHRKDQHTQVRCSKCNKKMERCHLLDHESDECVERLQSCHFCDLELPWKELDQHGLVCGSRTELCRDCGRYVTLRDQPEHGSSCSAADDGSTAPQTTSKTPTNNINITVICSSCAASFPAEDIEEHELECVPATGLYDEEQDSAEEEDSEDEDEDDSSTQEATAGLNSLYKATSLSDGASSGGDAGDPNQISTCPHCHLALPLLTLRWHTVKCQIHISLK